MMMGGGLFIGLIVLVLLLMAYHETGRRSSGTSLRRFVWPGALLPIALLLAACGGASAGPALAPTAPAVEGFARNGDGYADISVDQLVALMANKDFTLVNVHIPYEGEIPQTDLFIPFDEIQNHLDQLPAKDAPIVLYCRSGSMSTTAAQALVRAGYTNVMELDGGFGAWQAQGHELLDNR
jgi:rhodanese-related sulfurtransferase